jgi:hypothetical protein
MSFLENVDHPLHADRLSAWPKHVAFSPCPVFQTVPAAIPGQYWLDGRQFRAWVTW